jgi:hypothetical protein
VTATDILAGMITAELDPPGLDRARWIRVIGESRQLQAIGEADAEVMNDGAAVGRLCWSPGVANAIDVYGADEAVSDAAWNVAAALEGQFITLAELTSC